ncbi:hypothetical protein SXCC_03679 [Gluconacetobacter sp. SXCC-1]|nr:hypothetical protein SXCC_03679 [Gluconacetobacter sp. SXCC-1]
MPWHFVLAFHPQRGKDCPDLPVMISGAMLVPSGKGASRHVVT